MNNWRYKKTLKIVHIIIKRETILHTKKWMVLFLKSNILKIFFIKKIENKKIKKEKINFKNKIKKYIK